MKKIFTLVTIITLLIAFSSCGNKKKKTEDNVGYHTHEDGTVHRDDAHSHDAAPAQESFEVAPDSVDSHDAHQHETHDNGHDHSNDHNHDHQ